MTEIDYAFSDALYALQDLGHAEVANALMHRWQEVKVDPAVLSFKPEERPREWIPDFIDARFSQGEQTQWYQLYSNGVQPWQATEEMLRRRREGA